MVNQYRSDIDGLRAVAVGGVVLYHAFSHLLPGGFVGVDVFFVLSGFLITGIIASEAAAGTFSIAGFYERRFRRVLPALGAMLIAVTAAALVILPPTELAAYGRSLVGVAVFASNVVFWRQSGYFDTVVADKPLLHTWSLAVEEQFYIVWPLIAAALVRLGRRRLLGWFVWATVAVSLVAAIVMVRIAPSTAFYMLPFRAWELGFGALLAVGAVPAMRRPALRELSAVLGLAMIVIPMIVYSEATPFPGLAAVPPCLGTLLLIHAGQGHDTAVGRALSWRPILYTGLISYSFYLWHWPLLALPRVALDRPLHAPEAAAAVVAAYLLAALSLRYVEKPFRGRGTFAMSRTQVMVASAAAFGAIGAIGLGASLTHGLRAYASPQVIAAEKAVDSVNPLRARCHALDRQTVISPAAACTGPVKAEDGRYDVLLWGDSHADHLMPGLSALGRTDGFTVRQATVSGCSPITLFYEYGDHRATCPQLYRQALREAARQPDLRAVVVSARWSGIVPAIAGRLPAGLSTASRDQSALTTFESSLRQVVALVRQDVGPGPRIVLVGSTPEFDFWPATCIARAARIGRDTGGCRIATPTDAAWGPRADRVVARMTGPDVVRVFPRTLFCAENRCRTTLGTDILFRDDDHVTNAGSRMIARRIAPALAGPPAA